MPRVFFIGHSLLVCSLLVAGILEISQKISHPQCYGGLQILYTMACFLCFPYSQFKTTRVVATTSNCWTCSWQSFLRVDVYWCREKEWYHWVSGHMSFLISKSCWIKTEALAGDLHETLQSNYFNNERKIFMLFFVLWKSKLFPIILLYKCV